MFSTYTWNLEIFWPRIPLMATFNTAAKGIVAPKILILIATSGAPNTSERSAPR